MVHKKYTHRGDKSYGPYLYENKRVGGKVVTKYVGKGVGENSRKRWFWSILIVVILLAIVLAAIYIVGNSSSPTGRVSLETQILYKPGEPLTGTMKFNLKEGELIPLDSQVLITLANMSTTYKITDLVDSEILTGNYFAENYQLSGSGEGYGVEGTKTVYPTIDFDILISSVGPESAGGVSVSTGNESSGDNTQTTGSTGAGDGTTTSGETAGTETTDTTTEDSPSEDTTSAGTDATTTESAGTTAGSSDTTASDSTTASGESAAASSGDSAGGESAAASSGGDSGGAGLTGGVVT